MERTKLTVSEENILKKLYIEFTILYNTLKIKSHDKILIRGRNRHWRVETTLPIQDFTFIPGKNRNYKIYL